MNESLTLAKHIVDLNYNDIPSNVVATTKKSFLDGLGVMLAAGTLGEGCKQFVSLAIAGGGKEESTIIGFGAKVPVYMAALANGSMAHALDFEDVIDRVHPNAATIPAALAIAESIGNVSGKELITAVTLGSDIVSRFGLSLRQEPTKYGWFPTPIFGSYGATTAACKLLGLSAEQIIAAFSLNFCQATCSVEFMFSPHSTVRAIRDAFSTKSGVLSALLAQQGVPGVDQPIEGKAGLFAMYAQNNYDPLVITNGLGKVFEGANVSFKPWPGCGGTQSYIDATLQIVDEYDVKPDDIKEISFVVSSANTELCEPLERKRNPATAIDAKFSIPFAIATALVHKRVTLNQFTPQALLDKDVLAVAKKIVYEVDTKSSFREPTESVVQIKTKHNETYSKRVVHTRGHPENPISQEALLAKFKDCASHSEKKFSDKDLNKLIELISNLEEVKNIGEITELL